jgi:hypothetical protein
LSVAHADDVHGMRRVLGHPLNHFALSSTGPRGYTRDSAHLLLPVLIIFCAYRRCKRYWMNGGVPIDGSG